MKNLYAFIYLLYFLLIIDISSLSAQDVPKIHIDPSQAYGGEASEYLKSIEYIPLETTKESLFGDITQLIVTDNSYVIYDEDTKSVLFFALNGKFIKKISSQGNTYTTISFDENMKRIVFHIYDFSIRKTIFQFYSTLGERDKLNNLYENFTSSGNESIISLGNDYFAIATNLYLHSDVKEVNSEKKIPLINIYKGTSVYKSFLYRNNNFCKVVRNVTLPNISVKDSFYLTTPFDYNLYKVTKDTAQKIYQFVFPKVLSFSKNIIDSISNKNVDNIRNNISNDRVKVWDISNIVFQKDLMFFKLNFNSYVMTLNTDSRYQYNFIHNLSSGKLISFERITSDKTTSYLPIIGGGKSNYIYGINYHSGLFYSKISSLQMFSAFVKNKSRNPQYSPVLQQYFKTQDRKSNPVIVKMKFKDF